MKTTNIIRVIMNDGRAYNFGSLAAIYDMFSSDEIGVKLYELWTFKLSTEKPYMNDVVTISKEVVYHKGRMN